MANAHIQQPHWSNHHHQPTLALPPSPRPGMVVGKVVPDSMLKPITDIFILFGGWGGIHEKGEPWTPDRAAQLAKGKPGSAHVLEEVQKIKNPGRALKVIAFAGSLWLNELRNPGSNSMAEALQFIRSNYDPMGKIVIYGYSAGGLDALELVNYVPGCMGYYLVSSGEFYGPAGAAQHWGWRIGWRKEFVEVEVDLLVTVDAACGPSSGTMSRAQGRLFIYKSGACHNLFRARWRPNIACGSFVWKCLTGRCLCGR
jgi:hypothetical protein